MIQRIIRLCSFIQLHFEFILTSFIIYVLMLITYIRVKYPFWNLQPMFHHYDFWRYFYKSHHIINMNTRKLIRYYQPQIKTQSYMDFNDNIDEFVDFIHCNYIESDRVIMTATKSFYDSYFSGLIEPSFVSSLRDEMTKTSLIACMSSRLLHFHHNNIDHNIYYIDAVCIKRDIKKSDKIYLELFHTHIYNQISINPNVKSFIFKKETDLIDGLIPLVKFSSYLFHINKPFVSIVPLPNGVTCTKVSKTNFSLLSNFVEYISKSDAQFSCKLSPDLSTFWTLLNNKEYFVYCLLIADKVLAIYFFKNTHIQYEDYDDDVYQLVSSYTNTQSAELFFNGFMKAIQLLDKENHISLMILDKISHNSLILQKFIESHHVIFKHDCAYYIYNTIIPKMPILAEKCLCLM